jgi:alpha-1,3/alpha-1,6-mannosyltransferase
MNILESGRWRVCCVGSQCWRAIAVDISQPATERTGWLCSPEPQIWADALIEIVELENDQRKQLAERAKQRAKGMFGMDAMAIGLEIALREAVEMGSVRTPNWGSVLYFLIAVLISIPALLPLLHYNRP